MLYFIICDIKIALRKLELPLEAFLISCCEITVNAKYFSAGNGSTNLLNPCEHRTTIVFQTYLKSTEKGKNRDRRILSLKFNIKIFGSISIKIF
jgi:hypothetical protein